MTDPRVAFAIISVRPRLHLNSRQSILLLTWATDIGPNFAGIDKIFWHTVQVKIVFCGFLQHSVYSTPSPRS